MMESPELEARIAAVGSASRRVLEVMPADHPDRELWESAAEGLAPQPTTNPAGGGPSGTTVVAGEDLENLRWCAVAALWASLEDIKSAGWRGCAEDLALIVRRAEAVAAAGPPWASTVVLDDLARGTLIGALRDLAIEDESAVVPWVERGDDPEVAAAWLQQVARARRGLDTLGVA